VIYSFLPEAGIFGGVKFGFRLVEMLNDVGASAVVVLPDGRAPRWFAARAPILCEADALPRLREDDWRMITWPPDHERLSRLPGRFVNHCQGTDPRMDPILGDPDVRVLTCWEQSARWLRDRFGREPIEIGIHVATEFFPRGERKRDLQVAFMPRRGNELARRCMRRVPRLDYLPIDGRHEREVARRLRGAGLFLATAVGEEFGLPALEAMAAGCVVVSVPVKGGMEFLRDGENCVVADPEDIADRLDWIARPENARRRALLRQRAVATALRYRPSVQRRRLAELVAGPLADFVAASRPVSDPSRVRALSRVPSPSRPP
jgi:hypothetical protein